MGFGVSLRTWPSMKTRSSYALATVDMYESSNRPSARSRDSTTAPASTVPFAYVSVVVIAPTGL